MKASEKRWIMIMGVVAIIIIVVMVVVRTNNKKESENKPQGNAQMGEYTKVNSNNEIINISKKVNEKKEIEELELSNVTLKEVNGETTLKARITNKSEKSQEGFYGNIVLVDKENKEIGRIPVKVSEMKAGEVIDIEASITESYVNAYDYRLEK